MDLLYFIYYFFIFMTYFLLRFALIQCNTSLYLLTVKRFLKLYYFEICNHHLFYCSHLCNFLPLFFPFRCFQFIQQNLCHLLYFKFQIICSCIDHSLSFYQYLAYCLLILFNYQLFYGLINYLWPIIYLINYFFLFFIVILCNFILILL